MSRTFHPDFATPYKGATHPAIVQSSDDVYFHFDFRVSTCSSPSSPDCPMAH
jgi:hypothetical protein